MTNKCCDHCRHHSKDHDNECDDLSNHYDIIRHDITNIHGNGYNNSKFYDNCQDYLLDNTQHRTVTDSQIAHNIYYNRDLPDWTLRCKSISVSLVEQYSTLSTVCSSSGGLSVFFREVTRWYFLPILSQTSAGVFVVVVVVYNNNIS